jgi:uncharacterized protein YraI
MRSFSKLTFFATFVLLLLTLILNVPAPLKVAAQQATGSVPTVTSTPGGPYVTVTYQDQINVRAGPSSQKYPIIGVLLSGQTAQALGVSKAGDWIEISYPGVPGDVGWIFSSYVILSIGAVLPFVEAPSTPTPATTATIDPTVVAALITPVPPTRLPTFTPPGPLVIPTYESAGTQIGSSVPMGLVIVLLALIGSFGALISFLRGR